jgi:hypothetical protein
MTGEELERAIEFLLDHHAKVSADIERHSEQIWQLTQTVSAMAAEAEADRAQAEADRAQVDADRAQVDADRAQAEADRSEMRAAINNLIIANEVTRKLSEDVARLAVQTSQRVTNLETNR